MKKIIAGMGEALGGIWPNSAKLKLPQRVAGVIAHNDDISEVLVKIIQFLMFALWGAVYLAAPQPNPETISRVPLIISIYLLFTLVRLFIDLASRSPGWLIYLSIAVDMALLTFLIWSFHIQYDQPASFSLKSVEVMNYFVLISLRALRFEARYVIASGLFAAFCWSLLVGYVVSTDPVDPMITRDYVTYLTSNSVLIGAEISKILSILMFTVILAIAVRRAQYFLVSSITEENAANDLSRFMDTSVAQRIIGADRQIEAGEGERREAAILNIDIRGFTQMVIDMPPDEAMSLLSQYQHQIVPLVHRHHGTVDKFIGDGIMITFGASTNDGAYCANALRCIDEIIAHQKTWQGAVSKLNINMAVTAGPVIFGAVGDGDRLEVTVIGPSVNRSAKLEKHNKHLSTRALAGEECYKNGIKQGYKAAASHKVVSTVIGDDKISSNVVVMA
ncbi:MAG: adenylate/guanylate cyclase domain-containing protein [Rhizobiaceae bacterium]